MARIRSVKPEFWTSEQVMSLSRDARLLFIGLWNFCDDNGIHQAAALSLKAEVMPGDELNGDQIMIWVDEMIEQGLVEEYEANAKSYWRVTGWKRHQRIDQPTFRHPTSDAGGDAGDTGDTNKKRVTCVTKRLGGKQRQIVLKKLRHRDGDACHLCGDSSSLGIFSSADDGEENPNDINLLRLICSACKRKNKRGDAKKTGGDAGDTQGDAKNLDGDSMAERSGEERSGGFTEGSGKSKALSGSASDSDREDDDRLPPRPTLAQPGTPSNRAVGICTLLSGAGVKRVTAFHPDVAVTWALDERVTDMLLLAAVKRARESKGDQPIQVTYLKPIIVELLNPAPQKVAKTDDWAWKKSNQGIEAKGRELGMFARGGESYNDFAARIQAAIDKRKDAA